MDRFARVSELKCHFSIDSRNWGLLVLKYYGFLSKSTSIWWRFSQLIIWTFLFYAFAPQQNFTSIYKKNERKFLKMKKVRATFRKFLRFFLDRKISIFRKFSLEFVWKWKVLRSKIFENFRSKKFQNFHWKLYEKEIFRDRKFSIFSISKIFKNFSKSCYNFFDFQHFVLFFFL